MSNQDFDFPGAKVGPITDDDISFALSSQATAASAKIAAIGPEDNPDNAVRALNLGKMTGAPPAALYPQIDDFENDHRLMLNSDLIAGSPHLQAYLNADPMAAKVSHDDLINLDELSQAIDEYEKNGKPGAVLSEQAQAQRLTPYYDSINHGFNKGFGDAYGDEPIGSWRGKDAQGLTPAPSALERTPIIGGAVDLSMNLGEAGFRTMAGVIGGLAEEAKYRIRQGENLFGIKDDDSQGDNSFAQSISSVIEAELQGMTGRHPMDIHETAKDLSNIVTPSILDGRRPYVGVHPELDQAKIVEAKDDAKNFDQVMAKADAAATKERSPEMLALFIQKHPGLATDSISIDANAVARLYGDKIPEPDDGLLGFIPNLKDRIAAAADSGGYIEVPKSLYTANVDMDLHDQLKADILHRDNGLTLNEAEELGKQPEAKAVEAEPQAKYTEIPYENVINGDANTESPFILADGRIVGTGGDHLSLFGPDEQRQANALRASIYKDQSGKLTVYAEARDGQRLTEEQKATLDKLSAEPNARFGYAIKKGDEYGPAMNSRESSVADFDEATKTFPPSGVIPSPTQVVRGAGSFEPLFSVGDRNIKIEKRPTRLTPDGIIKSDEFRIRDQDGQNIGWLEVIPHEGGTKLYVDNIGGIESKGYTPNSLGPRLVRSLIQQLKSEYPNVEKIGGFRVTGAREKAGAEAETWIDVKDNGPNGWQGSQAYSDFQDIVAGSWRKIGKAIETYEKPSELYTAKQKEITSAIVQVLDRVVPNKVSTSVGLRLKQSGTPIQGVVGWSAHENFPEIAVSLESKDPVGTARHEAIHALRNFGFFTNDEWAALEKASKENGWIEKYNIDSRYADANHGLQLEESIAEAYADWGRGRKVDGTVDGVFAKLKDLFTQVKAAIAKALGHDFDWEDLFLKAEKGEIGAREGDLSAHKAVADHREMAMAQRLPKEPSTPIDPEQVQVQLPFGDHKAVGMPKANYDRLVKLIKDRHEADIKADYQEAYSVEKRNQSKEWQENRKVIHSQVEETIGSRPDLIVDRIMSERGGELKLDPASIPEELQSTLPKEYMRKVNSVNAEELALHFGYPTAESFIKDLAATAEDRIKSGLSHKDYVKSLVESETDRRMEAQHGFLEKNVLEEAKDRALSVNQIDLLHEESHAIAEQGKMAIPINRAEMTNRLREGFDSTPAGLVDSDKYIKAAGKAGRATETALLKGDFQEAYKQKQIQAYATQMAKWAHEYEKKRGKLDKLAKRYAKKEPPKNVEPEFVNHIQDQLSRAGYKTRRSLENIRENIGNQDEKTFEKFLEAKLVESYGYQDLPAPEFMLDPNWAKPVDQMSIEDFNGFHTSITALHEVGRDIKKFVTAGEKIDREAAIAQAVAKVETFTTKPLEYGQEPSVAKSFLARLTSLPTVFNRFDRGNKRGFFNRLSYDFARADNEKSAWERKVVEAWHSVGDYGDLKKRMDPPPMMTGWKYPTFSRQNLLGLIQNAGNRSNWLKTAKGWGAEPRELLDWVINNSTREDWQRAQGLGDKIFNQIVKEADKVEERVNGYTLDKLPLEPFEIDFKDGQPPMKLDGWYHPMIPDSIWYGEKQKVRGMDDSNFGHIQTSNGYTRSRTGAIYPADLGFGSLPFKINQMLHDITHREVVINAQKIMKDPRFLNAVTEHYGKEYSDLMVPYLRDMAGQAAVPSANWARFEHFSEYLRGNTMSTYIGFNPSTPMKHAPTAFFMSLRAGGGDFLKAYKQQLLGETFQGNTWRDFAEKTSEELQRREKHWQDTFGGNEMRMGGELSLRERIAHAGQYAIAKSDMFSARALWIGEFQKALREDPNMRDAIEIADASVRRQHGSTTAMNKPEIIRQAGMLHGWMTSVYGFMGERFQRIIETAQKMNDTYDLVKDREFKQAMGKLPGLAMDYATYVASVGLWEEAATYALSEDHKSTGMRLFDIAFGNLSASVVYLRDMYHSLQTGQAPGVGMLPSAISDLEGPFRDLLKGKAAVNRQHAGTTLQHLLAAIGIAYGVAPRAVGNAVKYGTDLYNNQAHPKGPADLLRGLARGQQPKPAGNR